MLTSVNIHSSVPVYEQIENHIQFAIASSKLKPGDRLPSVQELGKQLGVNFNTVAKAYRGLEVLGLIYTRRGMGCFINQGALEKCRETCRTRIVKRIHEVVQEAKAAGTTKKELTEIVNKSYASDSQPYGTTPTEVLDHFLKAKKKKK